MFLFQGLVSSTKIEMLNMKSDYSELKKIKDKAGFHGLKQIKFKRMKSKQEF